MPKPQERANTEGVASAESQLKEQFNLTEGLTVIQSRLSLVPYYSPFGLGKAGFTIFFFFFFLTDEEMEAQRVRHLSKFILVSKGGGTWTQI